MSVRRKPLECLPGNAGMSLHIKVSRFLAFIRDSSFLLFRVMILPLSALTRVYCKCFLNILFSGEQHPALAYSQRSFMAFALIPKGDDPGMKEYNSGILCQRKKELAKPVARLLS